MTWTDIGGDGVLQVLLGLLPGFLTVALIQTLTVREKKKEFERVVQALLYTFICHLVWQLVKALVHVIQNWNGHSPWEPTVTTEFVGLAVCAVGLALVMTSVINHGWVHAVFRKLRLTKQGSRPSGWYDAFYRRQRQYVVLHLKDGRRIFGWPLTFSELPSEGHIFLVDAQWLDSTAQDNNPTSLLVQVADIRFVEFVPMKNPEGT